MSAPVAYVCLARLTGRDLYFLWRTDVEGDIPDQVLTGADGRILAFTIEAAARSHAAAIGIAVGNEAAVPYDLDRIAEWCERPAGSAVDCAVLLDAWNLFADLGATSSVGPNLFRASQARENDLYERLFFGNNLPATTPEGEHYLPSWSRDELVRLSRIIGLGLQEFRSRLGPAAEPRVAADARPE